MNRDSYNAIASSWDAARHSLDDRERIYLDAFLDGLVPGSHILDLGCGTGRPIAEHLLERGYRTTGVDQAAQLLDLARSRFPQGTWIESTIEDFDTDHRFDGVICWDTLFHLDRSRHGDVFARVARMLRDDGRFMLSVGGSPDHPAFTDTMFGETFFYDSHAPEKVVAMLGELGFKTMLAGFLDQPTGGRDKGRYAVVGRKSAPGAA